MNTSLKRYDNDKTELVCNIKLCVKDKLNNKLYLIEMIDNIDIDNRQKIDIDQIDYIYIIDKTLTN